MENYQSELAFENNRLAETIALAEKQMDQARRSNEENKEAIIAAKRELRENTVHSIANLWSSEDFEALAELSQCANPVEEKVADYEETERKIARLEAIIRSPYYARIDFRFDGEEEFEKIYIGRTSLKKGRSQEMCVYDWRSPIASVFYRFVKGEVFYDAPGGRITGEVSLKRQYEIKDSVLKYFFDADVEILDEFLRELLSQNTSAQMKSIVETIQKEQDIAIRDMENDLLMVQGVAGSGKTSIAMHRAAYLMYQGLSARLSAGDIIIISPNTLFEQYISNVLPELGENNVVSAVFEEILAAVLGHERIQSRNQFLEELITNHGVHDVMKRSMEFKTSPQFQEILERFLDDIPRRWIAFEDVCFEGKCLAGRETLKRKILGRAETPLGLRLQQLEDFVLDSPDGDGKRRIARADRPLVRQEMQKFTLLNLPGLYRKLFEEEAYFYKLSEGLVSRSEIKDILKYTRENLWGGRLYFDDAAALAYLTLRIYGNRKYRNIRQVVIDEAQDYYPLQFEIFRMLFTNAKFTVLGDMNQTFEKREDLSLYERIGRILNRKKSSLITMDKSFRCTSEILNYSLQFIGHRPEIRSFNRSGEMPQIHAAADGKTFEAEILAEIRTCREKGYRSVGLICKSEKNAVSMYERFRDKTEVRLLQEESAADLQGIFLIPVYMSKGLEFDAVLICDADSGNYSSQEDKNFLYVACTRALHRLSLFCEGEVSPLL